MAKANVGSMNIKITGDASQLDAVFKSTAANAQQFGVKVEGAGKSAKQLTKNSTRTSRAMLELSRGVEDASVVWGTTGLQGALRASANNMSQFASILNPMAGAITGFAVAGVSLLIPMLFKWANGADEAKKETEKLTKAIDDQIKKMEEAVAAKIKGEASEKKLKDALVSKDPKTIETAISKQKEIVREQTLLQGQHAVKGWEAQETIKARTKAAKKTAEERWPILGYSTEGSASMKATMENRKRTAEKTLKGDETANKAREARVDWAKKEEAARNKVNKAAAHQVDLEKELFRTLQEQQDIKIKGAQLEQDLNKKKLALKFAEDKQKEKVKKQDKVQRDHDDWVDRKRDNKRRKRAFEVFEKRERLGELRGMLKPAPREAELLDPKQRGSKEAMTSILQASTPQVGISEQQLAIQKEMKVLLADLKRIARKEAELRLRPLTI